MTMLFKPAFPTRDILADWAQSQYQLGGGGVESFYPAVRSPNLDVSDGAISFTVAAGDERSELLPFGSNPVYTEGMETWTAYSFFLPSTFEADEYDGYTIIGQWHDVGGSGSPPCAFYAGLTLGYLSLGSGNPSNTPGDPTTTRILGKLALDAWTSPLVYTYWSTDPTLGSISAWINGLPVIANWQPPGGTIISTGVYPKIGQYRPGYNQFTRGSTIQLRDYRVATTRDEVAARRLLKAGGNTVRVRIAA